jgi:hypothetical protein
VALQEGNGSVHRRSVDTGVQALRPPTNYPNVRAMGSLSDDLQNRTTLFGQPDSTGKEYLLKRLCVQVSFGESLWARFKCYLPGVPTLSQLFVAEFLQHFLRS